MVAKQEDIGILPRGSNPRNHFLFGIAFPQHLVSPELGLVTHNIEIPRSLHQSSMRRTVAKGNDLLPQFLVQENFFPPFGDRGRSKKSIPSGKNTVRMRILDAGKILQPNPFWALLAIAAISLRHGSLNYLKVVVEAFEIIPFGMMIYNSTEITFLTIWVGQDWRLFIRICM